MKSKRIAAALLEDDLDPKEYTLSKLDPAVQLAAMSEALLALGWRRTKSGYVKPPPTPPTPHWHFHKVFGLVGRKYTLDAYVALGRLTVMPWGEERVEGEDKYGRSWSDWRTINEIPDHFEHDPDESIEQFAKRVNDVTLACKISDEELEE